MKEFEYKWFNFPSKKKGVATTEAKSYEEFKSKLLSWNKLSFGEWQYSEV